ncbi:MAG: alpha/beta hydrolase [Proteobacteria bacterium]|nr:MAG: alpha/beta hydrolase [Pseudomonadota bacterium]
MFELKDQTCHSADGTRIVYDLYGTGPVLIFITGAICHRRFQPVVKDAKVFAESFKVVNYDRRGRGDSSNTLPYSVEKEVEDIGALIAAMGSEKVFLYGHSSGAVLALEAALQFPSQIAKVALYEAPYPPNEKEEIKSQNLYQELKELISLGSYGKALRRFLMDIGMPKVFIYLLPLMPGWNRMKALAPTLEYDMILTKDLPDTKRLSSVQTPSLILYGEKSTYDFKTVAGSLKSALRNTQVEVVNGQDHMVDPKALLPKLQNFFLS